MLHHCYPKGTLQRNRSQIIVMLHQYEMPVHKIIMNANGPVRTGSETQLKEAVKTSSGIISIVLIYELLRGM